jgi:predicted Zn-dependent protease
MGKEIESVESAVYNNIRTTLISAKQKVHSVINFAMVEAYWEIGRQIMEAQSNNPRAEYGAGLISYVAARLTNEFGKGFTVTNLKYMRQFYTVFPNRHTLCDQLSWSHYRLLMKIDNTTPNTRFVPHCRTNSRHTVSHIKFNVITCIIIIRGLH